MQYYNDVTPDTDSYGNDIYNGDKVYVLPNGMFFSKDVADEMTIVEFLKEVNLFFVLTCDTMHNNRLYHKRMRIYDDENIWHTDRELLDEEFTPDIFFRVVTYNNGIPRDF